MKQLTIMLISLVTKYWVDRIHFHVSKWRFIIILWNYLIITSSAKMTFLGMLFRSVKLPLEENYHEYIFLFFLKVIYTNVPIKYLIGLSKIIYMVYLNTWASIYIFIYWIFLIYKLLIKRRSCKYLNKRSYKGLCRSIGDLDMGKAIIVGL